MYCSVLILFYLRIVFVFTPLNFTFLFIIELLSSSLLVLSFQNRKDESKTKPRGVFPGIPSWIAGNSMYLLVSSVMLFLSMYISLQTISE